MGWKSGGASLTGFSRATHAWDRLSAGTPGVAGSRRDSCDRRASTSTPTQPITSRVKLENLYNYIMVRNRTSPTVITVDPPSNLIPNHPNSYSIKVHTTPDSLYEHIKITSFTRATASQGANFVNNYNYVISFYLREDDETSDHNDLKYLATMEQVTQFLEKLLYPDDNHQQ
jgi:hypothetical protein